MGTVGNKKEEQLDLVGELVNFMVFFFPFFLFKQRVVLIMLYFRLLTKSCHLCMKIQDKKGNLSCAKQFHLYCLT